ncbi:MAG: hypothetical protein WCA45_13135 [Thiobacillaceae bacterium]
MLVRIIGSWLMELGNGGTSDYGMISPIEVTAIFTTQILLEQAITEILALCQLSYRPFDREGFEPPTSSLQVK